MTRTPRLASVLSATLAFAAGLFAQAPAPAPNKAATPAAKPGIAFPAASPKATLQLRFGVTDVEIVYCRPGAKGRQVFGGLVPYGEVWRTGANYATTVTFSTPVKFGGTSVAAGTYGLFAIPGPAEWTVILSKTAKQFGAFSYDAKDDVVRVKSAPVKLAAAVETFTIDLNDLRDGSATLNLVWDKTRVPVKVETDIVGTLVPQIEAAMAGDGRKPYTQAAGFYLEQNLDLNKALAWTEAAIAERATPTNAHLKAKILAKLGDKAGALAAARQSTELAEKAGGAMKIEYTKLNNALIAGLK
jgi:hypothetical protein